MWERLKYWLSGSKDCGACCLGCSYFEECRSDVVYESDEKEAYERDLLIDSIIKERIPDRRGVGYTRKSA